MRSLALVFLVACGHPAPTTQPAQPAHAAPGAGADDPSCPLAVGGTTISVEDAAEGPALVFVTTGDVAGVRTRATALAAMHNHHDGPASSFGMMFSTPSTATASEIEHGARVTFKPAADTEAARIGEELRMHAQMLTGATSCEMKM